MSERPILKLGSRVCNSGRRLGSVGDILIFRAQDLHVGCFVLDVSYKGVPCIQRVVSVETVGDDVNIGFGDGSVVTTSKGNEFILVGVDCVVIK